MVGGDKEELCHYAKGFVRQACAIMEVWRCGEARKRLGDAIRACQGHVVMDWSMRGQEYTPRQGSHGHSKLGTGVGGTREECRGVGHVGKGKRAQDTHREA